MEIDGPQEVWREADCPPVFLSSEWGQRDDIEIYLGKGSPRRNLVPLGSDF